MLCRAAALPMINMKIGESQSIFHDNENRVVGCHWSTAMPADSETKKPLFATFSGQVLPPVGSSAVENVRWRMYC